MGLRTAAGAAEQTGALQAVLRRAAGGGRVEWAGVVAGTARPRLSRRLHDSERLAASAAQGGPDGGRAAVRDAAGQAGASGLGTSGHHRDGRPGEEVERLHVHAGLQPDDDGRSGAGSETGNVAEAARGSLPAVGWRA